MRLIDADKVFQGYIKLCSSEEFKENPMLRKGAGILYDSYVRKKETNDNTIDAAPVVHTTLIPSISRIKNDMLECSNCGFAADKQIFDFYVYCPNCGALIDLEEE